MIRVVFGLLLLLSASAFAQTDPLTIGDTIGVSTDRGSRQTGNGYTYYGASQLAANQLQAFLSRSPDPASRLLTRQSRILSRVSTGLVIGSLGFFFGSFPTGGQRYRSSNTLLVAGYSALFGSLIPQSMSGRRLARAIASHNTYLRTRPAEYVQPVVYAAGPDRKWPLTAADTVAVRRTGIGYTYQYRGVPVQPGRQLSRLTTSLNDRDVNEGIRYVKTLNRIGSVVGSIGQGLLTGYLAGRLLSRRSRRITALDTELITTSALCIGANFVLTRHTNRAQRRWLVRYNDRLRQPSLLP